MGYRAVIRLSFLSKVLKHHQRYDAGDDIANVQRFKTPLLYNFCKVLQKLAFAPEKGKVPPGNIILLLPIPRLKHARYRGKQAKGVNTNRKS
jgi:hypothetical protein